MISIKFMILAINVLFFLSIESINGMPGMGGMCRINVRRHLKAHDFEKLMEHFSISAIYCKLEMNSGTKQDGCTGNSSVRWYFDVKKEECLEFNYSGCGGNQNNFESLEACKDRCEPTLKPDDMYGLTEQFRIYKIQKKID